MRIANTIKEHLSYAYIAIRRGIRQLYKIVLEPRSIDDDTRRRERLLLIILSGIVLLLVCFVTFEIWEDLFLPHEYDSISLVMLLIITFSFMGLYIAARKGYLKTASLLLVGLYFCATVYGSILFGASLPIGLLSYALLITMASILVSTRFGIVMAGCSVIALLAVGSREAASGIIPAWKQYPVEINDLLEYSLMLSLGALLSWLSTRELERSLHLTKESERTLSHERDNLERLVEERSVALQAAERERISELSRFAEFGKVSAGLFHDLMNPLAAVSLSIEHLDTQSQYKDIHAEAKHAVEIAVRATRRVEEYMSTFRNQIKATEEHIDFSVQEEIKIVFGTLYFKAREHRVTLHANISRDPILFGNPLKFNQILNNLVSNAIDAYDEVSFADSKSAERTVVLTISENDGLLLCTIEDHGKGIPADALPRVFSASFSTKNSGTGIGLAMTKDIVEKQFGGSIAIRSILGKSTAVTVTIPITHHS